MAEKWPKNGRKASFFWPFGLRIQLNIHSKQFKARVVPIFWNTSKFQRISKDSLCFSRIWYHPSLKTRKKVKFSSPKISQIFPKILRFFKTKFAVFYGVFPARVVPNFWNTSKFQRMSKDFYAFQKFGTTLV